MTAFIPGGPERYAHQRRGLAKMIETGGRTALLFDPGLGKTATVLDYAGLLALKVPGGEARVLVVCPLVAIDTWVYQAQEMISPQVRYWAEALGGSITQRGEALAARGGNPFTHAKATPLPTTVHPSAMHVGRSLAWAADTRGTRAREVTPSEGPPGLGTGPGRLVLMVTNLDTLASRRKRPYYQGTMADHILDAVRRFDPHLVVVDESHKIKGPTGNASRLASRISDVVPRRVILTGTVMPAGPLDVFAQWRFIEPYAFGSTNADGSRKRATFGGFQERYARFGGFMGHEVVGYQNLDDMQQIMAKNAVVARKDVLDLPPTTDVTVPVLLSPNEQTTYRDMKKQLAATLLSGAQATVPNRLTQMLRLRQITSGHLPDDNGTLNVVGTSKVDTIVSLVNDSLVGENRVVIFSLFSHEIAMLQARLATRRPGDPEQTIEVIEGATPVAERLEIRKRFGDTAAHPERIVLVAQIKTMSLAVNELVTASHAVFGSLSQQRDDLIQARDRLNRIGQTKPVTFWYVVVPGTVDTVILKAHDERTDLEEAMLRHISEDGD